MLTAFVTSPPSSAAATCSATITPARSCASSVEAARCGVTTTLSSSSSGPEYGSVGEDVERGAGDLARARAPRRAPSSSTSSPRAALTIRTPSRICAIASRVDRAARLVGQRQVQREEVRGREHLVRRLGALDAELAEALGARRTGRRRRRASPSPSARRATCWPIRPKPSTPSVLSASSIAAPARALPAALA